MNNQEYPYSDGYVVVLGPEIFASKDGAVLNWKGVNYVPMEDPDAPAPSMANWTCTIGEVPRSELPSGTDSLLRQTVANLYQFITGRQPGYIFSGWGHPLPERYRAVVEDRLPRGPWANLDAETKP